MEQGQLAERPYDVCPACGDDDVRDACQCEYCGAWFPFTFTDYANGDLPPFDDCCPRCWAGAYTAHDKYLSGTATGMTRHEKDIIREWLKTI